YLRVFDDGLGSACFGLCLTGDCCFNRLFESRFLLAAVPIPGSSPDAVHGPSKACKDRVPQPIAIASSWCRMILVPVALDAECELAGQLGVLHSEIYPVAGRPDLWFDRVAPFSDRREDRVLERRFRV